MGSSERSNRTLTDKTRKLSDDVKLCRRFQNRWPNPHILVLQLNTSKIVISAIFFQQFTIKFDRENITINPFLLCYRSSLCSSIIFTVTFTIKWEHVRGNPGRGDIKMCTLEALLFHLVIVSICSCLSGWMFFFMSINREVFFIDD